MSLCRFRRSFLARSISLLLYSMKPETTVFRLKLFRRLVDVVNQSYDGVLIISLVASISLSLLSMNQVPETVQETGYAVDASVIPLCIQFRRSYEQLIHSQGIAAVIAYQIIRGNNVALGLTHLDAVLAGDHTLVEQLGETAHQSQSHRYHTGTWYRNGSTADEAPHALRRRYTYQPADTCLPFPWIPAPYRCGCPHNAGNTRKNLPTGAWCWSLSLQVPPQHGQVVVYPLVNGSQRRFAGTGGLIAFYLRQLSAEAVPPEPERCRISGSG